MNYCIPHTHRKKNLVIKDNETAGIKTCGFLIKSKLYYQVQRPNKKMTVHINPCYNKFITTKNIARNYTSRYEYNTYNPHAANKKYLFRRRFCHSGMFGKEEVISYITEKLQVTRSPEQIANTPCELKMPCRKTIYRWLYEGYVAKRKTWFYITIKIPNRKATALAKAVIAALFQRPKGAVKTITCDSGLGVCKLEGNRKRIE